MNELQKERDDAVAWIRVVGEELVNAGFPSGDRTVHLASLRSLIRAYRVLAEQNQLQTPKASK